MIVGALVDAGADFGRIEAALDTLGLPGFEVKAEKRSKCGIAATKFDVLVDETAPKPERHLRHVVEIIDGGALPETVRVAAKATFGLLAEAEAAVHGTAPEKVHFHEVGAIDAIVDIVAAHYALYLLGAEAVVCSPVAVGSGTVTCEHGVLPVPAPATARLLAGKPIYGGDTPGELTTPTGAAIMARAAGHFGPVPAMRVEAIGYGSGTRDYAGHANVLRVMLGEAKHMDTGEEIVVLETNIDDMNPELLPPLLEVLLEEGARDAFITPVIGKKGRPAQQLSVLCAEDAAERLAGLVFRESSTLGLRMRRERRLVRERHWRRVATSWGSIRVKVGTWPGTRDHFAPEFEECRALARDAGMPVKTVYEAALAAAIKGEFEDA